MKNTIKKGWLLFGAIIVAISIKAQQPSGISFESNLQEAFKSITDYPQEKVYLHTDKPYYFVGDTIWLKAYLVNAITHLSGNGSRYVYVELINRKDKVQRRLKIQQDSIGLQSFIPLQKDIVEGDYYLRAYTQWMRNAGQDYFFSKSLQILPSQSSFMQTEVRYEQKDEKRKAIITFRRPDGGFFENNYVNYMVRTKEFENKFFQQQTNKQGEIQIEIPPKEKLEQYIYVVLEDKVPKHKHTFYVPEKTDYIIDFYPEGGNLIADVSQKIAFKALNRQGNSVSVTGSIVNQQRDTLTRFTSLHGGIGSFVLNARQGEKYKAITSDSLNNRKEFLLPMPEIDKWALTVTHRNEVLRYNVLHASNTKSLKTFYLLGHIRGFVLFVQQLNAYQGAISTKGLPEGILSLVLLDSDYIPHSERLLFLKDKSFTWEVTPDKDTYQAHSPVSLAIKLMNDAGQPLSGNFSLSVTDNAAVAYDTLKSNIVSDILLTSDLKGSIEEPGYYVNSDDAKSRACIDNLMLTHGWSRFNMDKLLKDKRENPSYFMELGQYISGKVTSAKGKPEAGKLVSVSVNGRSYPPVSTDQNGVFVAEQLSFTDTATVKVQLLEKGKLLRSEVKIDRDDFPIAFNPNPYENLPYRQEQKEYIEMKQSPFVMEDGILMLRLPEVVISSRALIKDRFSSYKMDDEEQLQQRNARTALDLVREVPGFQVIDNKPYINPNFSRRPTMSIAKDINNRNTLQPTEKINYGRTARFMLDNRTISYNALPLINADDIIGVHKIDPEVDEAINITQNLKHLEEAYNEALENGASVEELEELEVDKQLQQKKDGLSLTSGGCIVLTSRTGNLPAPRDNSMGDWAYLTGMSRYKSFYSPKYDKGQPQSTILDDRTTIYWQPQLKIGSDGVAHVRFYTAARPSYYTVIIEGITDKGVPCFHKFLLKR